MLSKIFPKRFKLLKAFIVLFLSFSFIVRLSFLIWNFKEIDSGIIDLMRIFVTGLFFDIGVISFFTIPYLLYLLLIPAKFHGSLLDKTIISIGFFIGVLILFFSFFGEFTFWDEFQRRYNFIAVDYLIYTYEVTKNINESYPLPILISALLVLVFASILAIYKLGFFKETFNNKTTFKEKIIASTPWCTVVLIFTLFITNDGANWSANRYNNELSKAGIYSFFSAFRNNELPYTEFYETIPEDKAFINIKKSLSDADNGLMTSEKRKIFRTIIHKDSSKQPQKPNVIFICIESLSGKYLKSFGSELNITPNLDALTKESLFFTNLFATGTRTVRGMEAITLSIPPTPGRSIVKRKNNRDLFTIGEVFKQQGYERNFFYGGDGYFDNMNSFFGGNGFNIVDRGRGFLLDSGINTTRTNIEDEEVTFENAWGICDEDIYTKVLKEADKAFVTGKPFFDFVMTTSNHKPYTYPDHKIDIPSGTGREGAIKYTDFAIGEFLKKARTKPWFENTVFVIMSDHCASSAGRWELDVQNYHIPALIYNAPNIAPQKVDKLCSQIDMFPSLFGVLNWDYDSNLFGTDILKMKAEDERAFIGNYRKLGFLRNNEVIVLNDQKKANCYTWNPNDNSLHIKEIDPNNLEKTISFYQVADYLYNHGGLKLKNK